MVSPALLCMGLCMHSCHLLSLGKFLHIFCGRNIHPFFCHEDGLHSHILNVKHAYLLVLDDAYNIFVKFKPDGPFLLLGIFADSWLLFSEVIFLFFSN
jgi:hypothetical protein